jgi:uncharacterized membrane protein YphA (DoxX/SURF4 family)
LLLVRAVFGVALLLQGRFYLEESNATAATLLVGLSAVASGGMLVFGFLTPIVGTIASLGVVGVLVSILPTCTLNLFDSKPALVFALTMLVSLIALGPGRFSVDARLFGRREIIIPPPPISHESR